MRVIDAVADGDKRILGAALGAPAHNLNFSRDHTANSTMVTTLSSHTAINGRSSAIL